MLDASMLNASMLDHTYATGVPGTSGFQQSHRTPPCSPSTVLVCKSPQSLVNRSQIPKQQLNICTTPRKGALQIPRIIKIVTCL